VLGLSDDEFYNLTPRQFYSLLEQAEHERSYQEFLFGQLCAVVGNYSTAQPMEPLKPSHFMPSRWLSLPKPRRKKQNPHIADKVRMFFQPLVTTKPNQ
jgi:hypothetical protein